MNILEIKDQVSIVDFLRRLGFEPARKPSGQENFYLSPLRASDTDPSFTVNDIKGKWYDHGEGKGGNIIDLGILLFKEASVKEVVKEINNMYSGLDIKDYSLKFKHENKPAEKVKKHEVVNVKPLGNNAAISAYLAERGVLQTAISSGLVKEVYYDHIDDDHNKKRYFGAGWQNDSGGWDVRSKYGKICIDVKDILTIKGTNNVHNLFEGKINHLSAVELGYVSPQDNTIVLNTLAYTQKVIDLLKEKGVKEPNIFFDNGTGGRKFTDLVKSELPGSIDKSNLYSPFDDVNDQLMDGLKKNIDRRPGLKR